LQNRPLIIYFHGGGFVIGSVESCEKIVLDLIKHSDYAAASVNYRLAPEYKFPYAIQDSQKAV